MQRYKLVEGELMAPPQNGIDKDRHAVTNFDRRVQKNATFAEENGYYPMGAVQEAEPEPKAGYSTEITWSLVGGCWQRHFVQSTTEQASLE